MQIILNSITKKNHQCSSIALSRGKKLQLSWNESLNPYKSNLKRRKAIQFPTQMHSWVIISAPKGISSENKHNLKIHTQHILIVKAIWIDNFCKKIEREGGPVIYSESTSIKPLQQKFLKKNKSVYLGSLPIMKKDLGNQQVEKLNSISQK